MNKVLIISPRFFDYQQSVGNAFVELGYEIKIETYDDPIHPFKGLLKWKHKFALNKEKLREKSREKYNNYIKDKYSNYQPNIVFIYNGTILTDETLGFFRKNSKVLLWMYDSVLRYDRAMCLSHIDHVDAFFCFEQSDVEYYKSIGKKAFFLPLACDTNVYYSIPNKKDIDILFVGTIYISKKRIKLLKLITNKFPKNKIVIYGHYKPFYKNPIKWLFREKRHIFKNVNIAPCMVNELFSRSRIAINIHNQQTFIGANQRVFEICGAGAYQICDANPFIESLFVNNEIGLYHNEDELIACIEDALHNDKTDNAKKAQDIIIAKHTFMHRIKQMLNILYEKTSFN
jgi:spore maturation protein CgeB